MLKNQETLNTREDAYKSALRIISNNWVHKCKINVGQGTTAANAATLLILLKDMDLKVACTQTLLQACGWGKGITEAYKPLSSFTMTLNGRKLKLTTVSNGHLKKQAAMLANVKVTRNNVDQILLDISKFGRQLQESIADSDKHIIDVNTAIYQTVVRAVSGLEFKHNFNGFDKLEKFEISRDVVIKNGYSLSRNSKGKISKVYYQDVIADVQDYIGKQIKTNVDKINNDIYKNIVIDDSIKSAVVGCTEEGAFAKDLYICLRCFLGSLDFYRQDKKKVLSDQYDSKLISLAEYSAQLYDLDEYYDHTKHELEAELKVMMNGYSIEDIGKFLVYISCIFKSSASASGMAFDENSINKTFLRIFPAASMFFLLRNDKNGCGTLIHGKNLDNYVGTCQLFASGHAEGITADEPINGVWRIEKTSRGYYACQSISLYENEVSTAAPSLKCFYVGSKFNSVWDIHADEEFKASNNAKETVKEALNTAKTIRLVPKYHGRINVVMALLPTGWTPLSQYECYSQKLHKMLDNLSFDGKVESNASMTDGYYFYYKMPVGGYRTDALDCDDSINDSISSSNENESDIFEAFSYNNNSNNSSDNSSDNNSDNNSAAIQRILQSFEEKVLGTYDQDFFCDDEEDWED